MDEEFDFAIATIRDAIEHYFGWSEYAEELQVKVNEIESACASMQKDEEE